MSYPRDEKKLEQWQKAISASYVANPDPWNQYDSDIRVVLATHLLQRTAIFGMVKDTAFHGVLIATTLASRNPPPTMKKRSSPERVTIIGWREVTYNLLVSYNGGGDGSYADKLSFACTPMTKSVVASKEKK